MEQQLTEKIAFRISEADRKAIEQVAAGFGMTMSEYLRGFTIRITEQIFKTNHNE